MGRVLRTRKKVDYHQINHKYDKYTFKSKPKPKKLKLTANQFMGMIGRASSAPPITTWPPHGMHGGVGYFADIATDVNWNDGSADTVWMPFKLLDITGVQWQGLSQVVGGADADAEARAHFDDVSHSLRTATMSTRITEAVGEAAAAMYVLENHAGFQMTWGAHVHSGTGIDQIWRYDHVNGACDYLIVEAKGPGAGLLYSPFLPPGYNQMDRGWVINHLHSMNQNGHAAGQDIVAKKGLVFAVAHQNYGGATKSYYGLHHSSAHATRPSRVFGIVVTAQWRADGSLGYNATAPVQYL